MRRPFVLLGLIYMTLVLGPACVRKVPLADLAPPDGIEAATVAEKARLQKRWRYSLPESERRVALISCAAVFRPSDTDLLFILTQLAPEDLRRAVSDRFCNALLANLAEDESYAWIPHEQVVQHLPEEHTGRSGTRPSLSGEGVSIRQAAIHEGLGWYGFLSAFPARNERLHEAAWALEADLVFVAGLHIGIRRRTIPLFKIPISRQILTIDLVQIAGYDAQQRSRSGHDFAVRLSRYRHYLFRADDDLSGLDVLAEAVAKALIAKVREDRE